MPTRSDHTAGSAPARPTGRLPSRLQVAFIATCVAIAAAFVVSIKSTDPQVARPPRSIDTTPTQSEAVDHFVELHEQFREASRERNLSGLSQLVTRDSPLIAVAERDVQQLISDGVLDKSFFENEDIEVTLASSSRLVIRQVVVIKPRFIDEKTGRELETGGPIRQTVEWTIHREDGVWKVHDAVVVASRRLRQ